MRHRVAQDLLAEFAAGSLETGALASVASHVDTCEACRDWLETYGLLAAALRRPTTAEASHPDTETLAVCSVRPEEIFELDRPNLLVHLRNCSTCRQDIELVRCAIVAARPSGRTSWWEGTAGYRAKKRWSVLAAGLAVLTISSVLFFQYLPSLDGRRSAREQSPPGVSDQSGDEISYQELSGIELDGVRVIEAGQTLTVSNVVVNRGAHVTFRAGQRVALGDGFHVGPGAHLAIEVRDSGVETLGNLNEVHEFSQN